MKLYLVRHGETDWNKVKKIQGQVDIPLNQFGKRLAEETEIQKVNTAFLGCKIESGNHEVKIIYHAPGTTTGKVLSLIGIAGFVLVLVQEKRKQKNNTR